MKKRLCFVLILCLLLGACGKSVPSDPTTISGEMTWQQQYDLGIRLLNEGKYEDAILVFQAMLEIDPKNVDVYKGLADAYVGLDDFETALTVIRDGIEMTGAKEILEAYLLVLEARMLGETLPDSSQAGADQETESVAEETTEEESPYPAEVTGSLLTLAQLFDEGAGNLITASDITLYGTPVVGLDFDTAVSIAEANGIRGWSNDLNDRKMYQGADDASQDQLCYFYTSQLFDKSHVYTISYEDNPYFDQAGRMPIGVRNIYMDSSMESMLTELGYTNGAQIVAEVQRLITLNVSVDDIYHAVKEMKAVGPMVFEVSRQSEDGVKYISYVTFRMMYEEVSVSFSYDTKSNALQQVYIDFNNLYKYR